MAGACWEWKGPAWVEATCHVPGASSANASPFLLTVWNCLPRFISYLLKKATSPPPATVSFYQRVHQGFTLLSSCSLQLVHFISEPRAQRGKVT